MIALSTSFASDRFTDGEQLLAAVENFDVSGIELEYRINGLTYHQIKSPLLRSRLRVLSIHNFFPVLEMIKTGHGSGDLFLLSHTDREERLNAVKWTTTTIEHANDLEAGVVILHCGRVEIESGVDNLHQLYRSGQISTEEAQETISKSLAYLDRHKPPHLDALMFSIDKLVNVADRYGVTLALENRYNYHELPGETDFSTIFSEFAGAPLGYWHDTGHAHVNELLTVTSADALLDMNRDHLVGIHLHDAIGLDDHLAPGEGDIDFETILAALPGEAIKVIELKPGTSDADVATGIKQIETLLYKIEKSALSPKPANGLTGERINGSTNP